jgi:hypothetical protein
LVLEPLFFTPTDGYGNEDGYGEGEHTRDYPSQPNAYSPVGGYEFFPDATHSFFGASNVSVPRMGMATLDLNSGEVWPRMQAYEGILHSDAQDRGISSSKDPLPFTSTAEVIRSACAWLIATK